MSLCILSPNLTAFYKHCHFGVILSQDANRLIGYVVRTGIAYLEKMTPDTAAEFREEYEQRYREYTEQEGQ